MRPTPRRCLSTVFAGLASLAIAPVAHASLTTFDGGQSNGWGLFYSNQGGLGDFPLDSGGNPGANLQWIMVDTFGMTLKNTDNPDVTGDLTRFHAPVTFGLDIKVNHIIYGNPEFGDTPHEVERNLIVEAVNYNPPGSDLPYTSVWFNLGAISLDATGGWTHFSTTVDPSQTALPAGWGGYGAEDAFGNPLLPADRSFASVMQHVDELRFTTYEPGFFYGFTAFNVQFDNVQFSAVPEPGAMTLALPALGALARRRKRQP